jgi:predicted nuclease of predicted toxin-antitoxin system
MRATTSIECLPVRDLNLQRASDPETFAAARRANVVIMTRDADFVERLEQQGPPPQVVLVTCGNTSNACLPTFDSDGLADNRGDARAWRGPGGAGDQFDRVP